MQTARMGIYVHTPVARVWETLIDYAGYARIPQVSSARVVRPGTDHPAGVGAVREISVLGATFEEEIVEFDAPRILAYRIVRCRPLPIEHDIGRVTLIPRGEGTEIAWTTRFRVGVPLVGDVASRPLKMVMQNTFNDILHWLKADLEARTS
jgi:hypothetical protein